MKIFKGQEGIFNAMKKIIVRWEWQKYPRIYRKNTYNYTLYHLYIAMGFQYLRHLYTGKICWCKCPRSFRI